MFCNKNGTPAHCMLWLRLVILSLSTVSRVKAYTYTWLVNKFTYSHLYMCTLARVHTRTHTHAHTNTLHTTHALTHTNTHTLHTHTTHTHTTHTHTHTTHALHAHIHIHIHYLTPSTDVICIFIVLCSHSLLI